MAEIVGVTFPLSKEFIERFFFHGKTVFIKPATCYLFLKPGMKFVFYQSRQDQGYYGEGRIKEILFAENPFDFFNKFDDKLFLTKEELENYYANQDRWKVIRVRKDRPKSKKKWIAIELQALKKYDTIKKIPYYITVAGQYIRE